MAVISEVTIYTDGACSGNPGPGGWAAILMAVIEGLKALKRPCKVDIYSDSAYVVNAFEQNWIGKWVKNGWKNSAKAEVANSDLWKELINLTAMHNVTFHKVKGHADNEFNNRCDELAVREWKKISEGKG